MSSIKSDLGGPEGYGNGVFSTATKAAGGNDDGSVQIDISSAVGDSGLKFFDGNYTSLYINSNGLITFGGPDPSYQGGDLSQLSQPSIAPFWADHSIDNGGEIYWDVDVSGKITITWANVAPYSGSGTNTYQVELHVKGNDDGDLKVELSYENIDWVGSGGDTAIVGVTDGAGNDFPLTGSGNASELRDYEGESYKFDFKDGEPKFKNGVVDGSDGNDNFSVGVLGLEVDKDGDEVTSGADSVLTGLGDDYVDAGGGEDTIHGGQGSDTIFGGDGSDEIYGDGISGEEGPATTSINASNFSDTSSGFRVTARNVEQGALTSASAGNVATTMGGFGAGGSVSDSDSNVTQQTGFDLASGQSEQLIVDFDEPISDASFSFSVLYSANFGEEANWAIYDNGTLVAQSNFTESSPGSGRGTIDLSGYGEFDQIIFTGLPQSDGSDGSDFLITDITFENPVLGSEFNDSLSGGDGVDAIFGGLGSDTIAGDAGDDTIMGEEGDDSIAGGIGADYVLGGAGSDTIEGGDGSDYIDGGEGDDLLRTGLGEDTLVGGQGNDTLMNSDGDDSLDGGAGDDSIVATGGEDTLRGGTGADTMDGGEDADTFIIEDTFGNDVITGGEGTTDVTDTDFDTIDLSALSGPVTVTYTGDEAGTITDGTDTITFTEIERIIFTDQDDRVNASSDSAGTTLEMGAGNDTVTDGSGADSIDGGDGNDYIAGNGGNDTFQGGTGDDSIEGGGGADLIDGGSGDDFLAGYDVNGLAAKSYNINSDDGSDDTLIGGTGDDTLLGGRGADSMTGGDGQDLFVIQDNFGNDTIIGGEGGIDSDAIDLSQMTGPVTVTYTGDEAGLITDGTDTITFSEIERFILTDQADVFDATADTAGVDVDAGDGNDTVDGGSGDDSIEGGRGDDLITGGDGDDTFTYFSGDGADTITDFNAGNSGALGDGDTTNNDFIDLSGYYDNLAELREDFDDDGVLNQSNSTDNGGTVDYSDNDRLGASDNLTFQGSERSSFTADNTGVVCFTAGTSITTALGDVPIETLCAGDMVQTRDNGLQPILWIGRRDLDHDDLAQAPHLHPIHVGANLIGTDMPLIVSPQHGVLVRQDGEEILVRAKHLAMMEGGQARVLSGRRRVTYIHILFETHQIVFANGAPTESFYPGPQALIALNGSARDEVLGLFPELESYSTARSYGVHVRPVSPKFSLPRKLRELTAVLR